MSVATLGTVVIFVVSDYTILSCGADRWPMQKREDVTMMTNGILLQHCYRPIDKTERKNFAWQRCETSRVFPPRRHYSRTVNCTGTIYLAVTGRSVYLTSHLDVVCLVLHLT